MHTGGTHFARSHFDPNPPPLLSQGQVTAGEAGETRGAAGWVTRDNVTLDVTPPAAPARVLSPPSSSGSGRFERISEEGEGEEGDSDEDEPQLSGSRKSVPAFVFKLPLPDFEPGRYTPDIAKQNIRCLVRAADSEQL